MIEGIEILNQTEIIEKSLPSWVVPATVITAILCLVIGIILSVLTNEEYAFLILIVLGLALCLLYATVGAILSPKVSTGRYRYEATIDDTVSFKELYEKYNIIEQRGKIYILEDKDVPE